MTLGLSVVCKFSEKVVICAQFLKTIFIFKKKIETNKISRRKVENSQKTGRNKTIKNKVLNFYIEIKLEK